MFVDEDYYINIFRYLVEKRIVPFIEEQIDTVMTFGEFTGYYKEEQTTDGTYIRPIYNLNQLDFLLIGVMIDELEKEETKRDLIIRYGINFSYDSFFPWLNTYMKDRYVLCYIYSNGNDEYVFFVKFELNFIKITSFLSQYLF